MVWGFTGPAFVLHEGKSKPTLEWFAERVAQQENAGLIDFGQLAGELDSLPVSPGRERLTLMGIGYIKNAPHWLRITNMYDDNGQMLSAPRGKFVVQACAFEGEIVEAIGGNLTRPARRLIQNSIPKVYRNRVAVQQVLAGAIERSMVVGIGDEALVALHERDPTETDAGFACNLVTPGRRGPVPLSQQAMPVFVSNGWAVAMRHQGPEHVDEGGGWVVTCENLVMPLPQSDGATRPDVGRDVARPPMARTRSWSVR